MNSLGPALNSLFLGLLASMPFEVETESHSGVNGLVRLLWKAIQERSQRAEAEGLSVDRFGAIVAFACSYYGVSTLIVAVVLNRTAVIASTHRLRRHRQGGVLGAFMGDDLSTSIVVSCLRIAAVTLMVLQVKNILTTLWVIQKTANPSKLARLTKMIPTQFFEYIPQAHSSLYMKMPPSEIRFGPTSAMLWPVFCSMCFSLFAETFCSAIVGDKPFLGGGTTLFEISVAIQEVSASILLFGNNKLAKRPSEKVLMICLFLLVDHILSHLGSMANKNKYRLISLTITSTLFVWYFVSTFFSGLSEALEFPFSIAMVYLCLVFVLMVSLVCLSIFLLAILAKTSNLEELNYASYFWNTDDDTDFFSKHLNLSLSQDFYTAMMNIGLFMVSLAGKSSYIKEYNAIFHGSETWLEKSLWSKIQLQFQTNILSSKSSLVRDGRVLAYLKENQMTGYSNVVNTPSSRVVNGSSNPEGIERLPVIKLRYEYVKAIGLRFLLLLYSLVFKVFFLHYIPKFFRKLCNRESESDHEEEFEYQRSLAPGFVQSIMRPPNESIKEIAGFSLENVTEDVLTEQYAAILRNRDLADIDTSPDFLDGSDLEVESEYDSDVELVNSSQAHIIRGQEYVSLNVNPSNALSEIMTPENMEEFLKEENLDILRVHLQYDSGNLGTLTRSRYRRINSRHTAHDEPAKLLDVLLSKRKVPPTLVTNNTGSDDENDIDPRFACVICQVAPREIITWPCKCFSICEGCRLSLVSKGLEGCVTCRRDVEGVSRVFIP